MPETAVLGSIFLNDEGVCIACEERVARVAFGGEPSRIVGRPLQLAGLDETKLGCALRRARSGEAAACLEAEPEAPGTDAVLMVCLRRLPSSAGLNLEGAIEAVVIDVTGLKRENEELRRAVERRDTLLREVHHRVKNNLQVISSLLGLHASTAQDDVVRSKLRETQDRVNTIAIIHETLYQSEDQAQVNLPLYIDRLVGYLRSAYAEQARQVDAVVEVGVECLDLETAVPCGLIVSELVANCFKHAFPDGRPGKLAIRIRRESGGGISLIVADTGVGIADEYLKGRSQSLGLRLVHRLVRQLGGTVEIHTGDGTEFLIRLPEGNR